MDSNPGKVKSKTVNPGQVKSKTVKLLFAASPISTQHLIPDGCCFSEWVSEGGREGVSEGVSEWVSEEVFNTNSPSLAISWREQVNFQWDDDDVRSVLDQHA